MSVYKNNNLVWRKNMNINYYLKINKFHEYNENTINRLEKAQIKLGYRKYLRIINNRIKLILSKEENIDNPNKNSEETELMDDESTSNNMDVESTRILKRKLSNKVKKEKKRKR